MSIEWLQSPICAPHGRGANQQLDWFIERSAAERGVWQALFNTAWFVSSVDRERKRRLLGIKARWPVCDLCVKRLDQRRLAFRLLVFLWLVAIIALIVVDDHASAAVLLMLSCGLFVSAIVAAIQSGIGRIMQSRVNNGVTAVIVHDPHPAFYEEATRQIRLRTQNGSNMY
ncbi:hypothetical protein FZI91_07815 [Mycobacterium sp. CBMA271]|uniref:hypothetical protein n=1 Tax=unclassified Mycobacteroides TaxID=2618759 RepID=UPI0012DC5A68|nr:MULTISPECIES: hypothetical protein [unclassified Mycobacteroides]MUM21612.1 hypothetical protein [Mycobacteroides sp. CBMA 271]